MVPLWQINALAVIANFVETEEGARFLCQSPKLLEVRIFDWSFLRASISDVSVLCS